MRKVETIEIYKENTNQGTFDRQIEYYQKVKGYRVLEQIKTYAKLQIVWDYASSTT